MSTINAVFSDMHLSDLRHKHRSNREVSDILEAYAGQADAHRKEVDELQDKLADSEAHLAFVKIERDKLKEAVEQHEKALDGIRDQIRKLAEATR